MYAGLDTQYSQVSQEACTRARQSSEKGDRNGKGRVKFPIGEKTEKTGQFTFLKRWKSADVVEIP